MRNWLWPVSLLVLLLAGLSGFFAIDRYQPLPSIQGVYLSPAAELKPFELRDHHNQPFTPSELRGQWHLISYGYTHCPDICPMTLVRLSELVKRLEQSNRYPDLQVLFYSVDPQRDKPKQLAQYVPYFQPDFVGLTQSPEAPGKAEAFEQSLGIIGRVDPDTGDVSHGVRLFLLNPKGHLQAVFEPESQLTGPPDFDTDQLFRDYVRVRERFAGS